MTIDFAIFSIRFDFDNDYVVCVYKEKICGA